MAEDRLSELYRRYGPSIYERCRRLLRDGAVAEEATQEVFLRVYRNLDRAPDGQAALGWIYRVATNYCLNELRSQKLRPQSVAELPEVPIAGFESQVVDGDTVSRLLEGLDDETRSVVFLHYVDGIDQGEVAQVLGISRRTVVNRLTRFRERSQQLLSAPGSAAGKEQTP